MVSHTGSPGQTLALSRKRRHGKWAMFCLKFPDLDVVTCNLPRICGISHSSTEHKFSEYGSLLKAGRDVCFCQSLGTW